MVKFSKEEQKVIDMCRAFYRSKVMPDMATKDIPIGDAIEFSHSKGEVIGDIPTHDIMYAIFSKIGIEFETNEVRQVRLAKERKEKIMAKRMGALDSEIAEKQADLKKAVRQKNIVEAQVKSLADEEESITVKESNAKKAQVAAEQVAAEKDKEIAQLKALLQKNENQKNLAEANTELSKGEEATLTAEPPAELTKEPPTEIIVEIPAEISEEKTIDELIEDLKE